jgi:hypothetical protein
MLRSRVAHRAAEPVTGWPWGRSLHRRLHQRSPRCSRDQAQPGTDRGQARPPGIGPAVSVVHRIRLRPLPPGHRLRTLGRPAQPRHRSLAPHPPPQRDDRPKPRDRARSLPLPHSPGECSDQRSPALDSVLESGTKWVGPSRCTTAGRITRSEGTPRDQH